MVLEGALFLPNQITGDVYCSSAATRGVGWRVISLLLEAANSTDFVSNICLWSFISLTFHSMASIFFKALTALLSSAATLPAGVAARPLSAPARVRLGGSLRETVVSESSNLTYASRAALKSFSLLMLFLLPLGPARAGANNVKFAGNGQSK